MTKLYYDKQYLHFQFLNNFIIIKYYNHHENLPLKLNENLLQTNQLKVNMAVHTETKKKEKV